MEDLLELNPKHEKKLTELFHKCLDNGMPKDKAFKEMYRLFFEDENNWLTKKEAV
jgi:hypothetical protein